MFMLTLVRLIAVCSISTALLPAAGSDPVVPVNPNIRVVEEIVAKVNNDIITRGELEKLNLQIESELRLKKGLTGAELVKETKAKAADALRDKIDQLLLIQKGKDLNIKVEAEITRRFAEIQVDSKISDPDKFHDWIREQSGGIPYEDVRQNMTDQLTTQKVIGEEVGSKINVPQPEIQKYYDEHKAEFVRQEQVFLREILIAPTDASPAAWAAADKKAKEIYLRAKNNEKFTALARDYSAAETARNDGELGAFKRGELKKELEDKVFNQTKGFITEPTKTDNGYLILKLEDRYAPGQASLDDVKNEIMDRLYTPRLQPALRTYLTKLREDAFLEIRGGYVDSGAAPNKDTSWKDPATLKPDTTTKEEVAARKHKKKMLGVSVPFTSTAPKTSTTPPPPPLVTPVSNTPVTPPDHQ
jgi:parvulin-like peptidyl-prolyl isomerase